MQALFSWDISGTPPEQLLEFSWVDRQADREDTLALARILLSGTLERVEEVDAALEAHLEHW
ncbi:MAG: N utilization substance protein B, partial [Spirochaetota bacterium]